MLAMFTLAACSSTDEVVIAPACPNVVIVKDTAEMTVFQPGPGRDLTDVMLEGRVVRFDGECSTDLERDKSGTVTVDLQLIFEVLRGPANDTAGGSFRYFVAIANRDGDILAKKVFDTEFEFEGNRPRVGGIEELTQEIPLKAGELGEDFDIFVGFQLDPEQLKYNRAKGAR
ncbi:MAG: hypothetical protein OER92_05095 [Alphaproteobacteria bacterium]|nr:hypothetical protein [Alphaproteobacteria bacterium]